MTALAAGPELDRRVAERVMGWRAGRSGLQPHDAPEDVWIKDGHGMCTIQAFMPSTKIANAWEVVDRLIAIGHSVSVKSQSGDRFHVLIMGRGAYAQANGPMPLAICLAALAAVGGGA